MNCKCARSVLLIALFLFPASLCGAQMAPITVSMQQEDRRLETPVSFAAPRICLGELLETLSRQTGVSLSIRADDPFSGIPLCIVLREVPLRDALNALWSALSYQGAAWDWRRTDDAPRWRYEFRPLTFRGLPAQLEQEAQTALEEQAELMSRMAFMSPQERRENVSRLAETMFETDTRTAEQFVDPNNRAAERIWQGMRIFAALLSPMQRARVLRGERMTLPLDRLNDEGKAYVSAHAGRSQIVAFENGVEVQAETLEPDSLRFELSRRSEKQKRLSAHVMIGIGRQGGFTSISLLGFVDSGVRQRLRSRWLLPDEKTASPLEARTLERPAAKAPLAFRAAAKLEQRLWQVAQAASCSIIAVLPEGRELPPDLQGPTLAQELAVWQKEPPDLMVKWRGETLLVNYPAWFYGDDAQVPYQTVKQLRRQRDRGRGLLTLPQIAEILPALNSFQVERLSGEFPILKEVAESPALVELYRYNPAVLSEAGIAVNTEIYQHLMARGYGQVLGRDNQLTTARILQTDTVGQGWRQRAIRLQVYTTQKRWATLAVVQQASSAPGF